MLKRKEAAAAVSQGKICDPRVIVREDGIRLLLGIKGPVKFVSTLATDRGEEKVFKTFDAVAKECNRIGISAWRLIDEREECNDSR